MGIGSPGQWVTGRGGDAGPRRLRGLDRCPRSRTPLTLGYLREGSGAAVTATKSSWALRATEPSRAEGGPAPNYPPTGLACGGVFPTPRIPPRRPKPSALPPASDRWRRGCHLRSAGGGGGAQLSVAKGNRTSSRRKPQETVAGSPAPTWRRPEVFWESQPKYCVM